MVVTLLPGACQQLKDVGVWVMLSGTCQPSDLSAACAARQVIVVGLYVAVLVASVFLFLEFTLKFTDVRASLSLGKKRERKIWPPRSCTKSVHRGYSMQEALLLRNVDGSSKVH